MRPLLRDLTLEEKGALARKTQIEFVRYLAQSEVAIAAAEEGVEMCWTPVDWAFCNGAYLTRDPGDDGAEIVERIFDFFARNERRNFMIWLEAGIDRAAWEPVLLARGLRHEQGAPCMTLDTRTLPAVETLPDELQIVRVGDLASMDYFARASAAGFSQNEAITNAFVELWSGFDLDGPLECYLGYVGDEIVTTAAAHVVGGVVGVEFVSTIETQRRRGYGGAITQHIAYAGRARGYRYATLSASELGRPVYERLGFVAAGFADHYYPVHE